MFTSRIDKKAAMFLADGCEEVEALTTYDLLYRAGIECTKVSITDRLECTSSHEVTIKCDATIGKLNFDSYDMIILPGGIPGTPNLRACDRLCEQIVRFADEGRQLAAICAAPSILAELGLLKGRNATCNPSKDDVLRENGANLLYEPVVVDGNIITSRAMGTAVPFGLAIVEHYFDRQTADALRDNILFGT